MPTAKAYTLWQGKNKFLFKGRIMLGPDCKRAIITIALILIPEIVFLSTTSSYFSPAIPVFSIFLMILCISALLLTASSNPGYIPRQEFPFNSGPFGSPTIYTALVKDPTKAAAIEGSHIEIISNGTRLKLKYCRTCWVVRPPRTSHCHDCDMCIEKFDHHCPWVGICIGKYNYMKFLSFLFSADILCLFNLIVCVVHICLIAIESKNKGNDENEVGLETLEKAGASIFLSLYMTLFFIFIGGLSIFHCYLLVKDLTTNEYMKKSYRNTHIHPFDRSGCLNKLKFRWIWKKIQPLILTTDINIISKDTCFNSPSSKAMIRLGALTELDNRCEDANKVLDKDQVSETPSIIHEDIKAE